MNKLVLLKQYLLSKHVRRFSSREAIQVYQNKKIKKHLAFVLKHSPFYQNYYQNHQLEWETLPVISKREMMDHFDELNTAGITKKEAFQLAAKAEKTRDFSPNIDNVSIGLSSGTSGNRGLFLVSEKESAMWAGEVLAKLLPGSLMDEHKIAFFLRANNNLYESTKSSKISFHFFDLVEDLKTHQNRLHELKPTIIIAPPSMLRMIAEWKGNNLIDITPGKIISVAEVLEDVDKTFIEEIFQQTLHQVYQATEGFLATTCSHGVLHMNEDIIAIQKEYLDKEKGIFVPIITDFTRRTQPLIRYRLNDVLIERKTPCPCGSHFLALERIDGRCDDIFHGVHEQTGKKHMLFPDFIRRAIMLSSDDILEYKVTQKELFLIDIKLKVKNEKSVAEAMVIQELEKLWKENMLVLPKFTFTVYDLLASDRKRKRIENVIVEPLV
ncbi:F390 synthetase-related protein [Metabacillus halosaccharovorans]|uniref:F390 synthetase-related protein n=1 Tax=Metabacillus halosaccharovorans TaxID=930124 RepID=UPI00204130C6|nr:F390 synthetase-related protein [Metabacillus halosaccharovorans]MCM3439715.1 adenylate cyclase [Metabacillus halosaccharovorans]